MPTKKQVRKPSPVEILFAFSQDDDGAIRIAYEGYDKRTHEVARFVIDAIAEILDLDVA
jgi:soluble P-type ATPase